MIELLGLNLQNVVYFEKADVKFDQSRITFVRGLNLDSDPASPTGNGAGKSLLFSCPSNVLYFSPPLALKKKAKKELLGKGSAITLSLKAQDGHKYDIEQRASKYVISRDGENLEMRTVPLAEKFIREKLFPLSELVYYSTGYVSTQRPFAMQNDSDADRLSHLSEIFQLEDYDLIRRFFLNKLGEIRDSELQLQVLERDVLEANTRLKKAKERVTNSKNSKSLKTKKDALDKDIERLVDDEFNLKSLVKNLNTLLTVEEELDALRSSYKSKQAPKAYIKFLKEQRKIVRAWASYEEVLASYKKSVRETQSKLDALTLPSHSAKKIQKRLAAVEEHLENLENTRDELRSAKKEYDSLKEKRDDLLTELGELGFSRKKKPDLDAKYDDDIASCRTTLNLKKLLNHDHEGDDSTCPTCMSEIDLDNIRTLVKKAQKKLPELEAARAAQRVWAKYAEAEKAFAASSYDQEAYDTVVKSISSANKNVDAYKSELKVWDRHDLYTKMLADTHKPEQPEHSAEVDMDLDRIDDTIELCEDIIKHLGSRDKLIESNQDLVGLRTVKMVKVKIEDTETELGRTKKVLKNKRDELAEIVQELDTASALKHEIGVHEQQVARTQAKIDKMKPLVEDKKMLETLAKAYSSKGLKTIVANEICGLLEQNLNAYSNLIFAEPFVFSVQAKDSGLSIIVDRGNDKISDVRNLSGAESNAFRLLFVFSLLPLLPAERRINMLTLDEPCSHMDEVFRTKFLHVFLPALSEIVPHIYVITPNPEDYCEGSAQWIVRKSRGKSTLITDGNVDAPDLHDAIVEKVKRARKAKTETKPKKSKRSKSHG